MTFLEHFQEKCEAVFRPEMREIKDIERFSDLVITGNALGKAGIKAALLFAVAFGLPVFASPLAMAQDVSPTRSNDAADLTAELQRKRNETRGELELLIKTMKVSAERVETIERSIANVKKTSADVRQALIESAARRKSLQTAIDQSEEKIARFGAREVAVRASLRERRALLAEVLAALQRMGRNPPPALLVSADDALASVRSAILLGAVVPGMRHEAARLVTDLTALSQLRAAALAEKTTVTGTIAAGLEEERRMDLLLAENERLGRQSTAELDVERRRAEELAGRANNLDGLIQSIENEIASVREAIDRARAEEERQRMMSDAEREKARKLAESGVPDKNRIAPAYPFASLRKKLELPAAGEVLRVFGQADGAGHAAKGITVATRPGSVVTAPADGLVVFSGAFRSYGKMIILNAGDGYHLVLTGMDEVRAGAGKFVFAGEPIAVMGEKRIASATALALETTRPTLYIEFRKDGTPVDSKPWWTAKETGRAPNDS